MSIKELILSGVIVFIVGLLVSSLVTFLWEGTANWATSFRLAISLGVALPVALAFTRKKS